MPLSTTSTAVSRRDELHREQEELKAEHLALDTEIELAKQQTARAVSAIEIEGEGINNQLFKRLEVILNDKKITEEKIQKEVQETNGITAQIAKGQAVMGEIESRIEQEQELILHKLHAQLIEVNHKKVALERDLAVERGEYLRVLREMIDDAILRQQEEQQYPLSHADPQDSIAFHRVESGGRVSGAGSIVQGLEGHLPSTGGKETTHYCGSGAADDGGGDAELSAIMGNQNITRGTAVASATGAREVKGGGDAHTTDKAPHLHDLVRGPSYSILSSPCPTNSSSVAVHRSSSIGQSIPAVTTGSTRSNCGGSPEHIGGGYAAPSPAAGVLVLERELNRLMVAHRLDEERRFENEEMSSFLSGVLQKCLQETALERDKLASTQAELAKTEADLAVMQSRRLVRGDSTCSGDLPSTSY